MRSELLRFLGAGGRLQSSYLPGRSGFVLTTSRSLPELRRALMPRTACRLYPIHPAAGRYFLEPTESWLCAALDLQQPDGCWSAEHQRAREQFFCPLRRERVRRLPPPATALCRWSRGFRTLRELALRLEALPSTPRPDKHWRGLAEAFDAWWTTTSLYAAPQSRLAGSVLAALGRHRRMACPQGRPEGTLRP